MQRRTALLVALHACTFVSSSPGCHLRSPRRCGPVISPGGHHLSVLQPQARPPPNLLYVSRTTNASKAEQGAGGAASPKSASRRAALVCVPAKGGSTSFYFWLYRALAGIEWPHSGPPWIQDVASERWALPGVHVARFASMPFRQRLRALSDASVRRFALTREPLDRAVSAFYSKLACAANAHTVPALSAARVRKCFTVRVHYVWYRCATGDAADHAGAIRQLMRQAPKTVAQGFSDGSYLNLSTPCLSAVDFARMALEARNNEQTRWEVHAAAPRPNNGAL
jgi:hypothetical protein